MADYVVKGESLAAVADAIREKTGETEALGLSEMPGRVTEVFEAGKKSEYDAFWDAFQEYGNRENYYAAFYGWPHELFKPKYDIIPTGSCSNMFSHASIKNLASIIENAGIVFDASNATNVSYMFNEASALVEAPTINATNATSIDRLFNGCSSLEKASVVFPKSKPTAYTNVFARCASLEDFTAFGEISVPLSFSASPLLTHDSLMSIINCLKDYSGSGTTYTVTLGAENLAKLTDAEKQIGTQKGWTLA